MWNPVKIEFENLFSHKHSVYEFKNNACTVIFGKNMTDKSLDNNGAGKTTLFEAICIALTSESLRNIKKDAFINREEDECKITFELYNSVMRMKLVIQRVFYRGSKSSQVFIWENGVLNDQLTSVNDCNKRIMELIGISKEDLLRYFIISQDNTYTFFTASDAEKKEVMNRITSADVILPAIEELDKRREEIEPKIEDAKIKIMQLEQRKETLEEQLSEARDKSGYEERIAEKKSRIKSGEEYISQWEEDIQTIQNKIDKYQQDIQSNTSPLDVSGMIEQRKKSIAKMSKLQDEISENNGVIRKVKNELMGKQKCPKCGEEFIPKSTLNLSVEECEDLLKQANEELERQNALLQKLEEEIEKQNKEIKKAQQQEDYVNSLRNKKAQEERKLAEVQDDIKRGKKRIEQLQEEIREIEKERDNNSSEKGLLDKIKDCDNKLVLTRGILNPLENSMELIKFWKFNLGRSGFTTYLANKSVKIIEGITNSYLRKFGVEISVVINGFKVLKSGDVREKIDVFVTNDGLNAEQFLAKSGGERGRVILAGILGIQHLINASTNGKGLNLLVLDEALSGIDCNGTMEIIKTIEQMNTTVLMITQNIEDVSICKNYLQVVKEDGVSRYVL